MRLPIGEVLGLNEGLTEGDTRGRTSTLTVCEAAHGKLVFLLKTSELTSHGKLVTLGNMSEVKGPLGGYNVALLTNGGRNGHHGLKDVCCSGGKLAGDGWNMAGVTTELLAGRVFDAGRGGAGLFLISCFRHLARRF